MAQRTRRASQRATFAVVLASLLVVTACTSDPSASVDAPDPEPRTATAPWFVIGAAPEGYRVAWAGDGRGEQSWGDDTTGTDPPTTVLAPSSGRRDPADLVLVSSVGYEGNQGGLAQSHREYLDLRPDDIVVVDGRDTMYAATADAPRPGQLLVDHGDDLAVLVEGPADRDLLLEIAEATAPQGRVTPPEVQDPPGGLEVVGQVHADVEPLLHRGGAFAVRPAGVGPRGAHSVALLADDGSSVGVVGLAGTHADLTGIRALAEGWATVADAEVADRPALIITREHRGDVTGRTLLFHDDAGNLFAVGAEAGQDGGTALGDGALVELATSIELVDEATWDLAVAEAGDDGAPAVAPGAVALAEGTTPDGTPWIFQTADSSRGLISSGIPGPVGSPCLAVPRGEQICLRGSSEKPTPNGIVTTSLGLMTGPGLEAHPDFPQFLVVTTSEPATSIRVLGAGPEVTAHLLPIAGTPPRSAAIAFLAQEAGLGLRVELLDEAGAVVATG